MAKLRVRNGVRYGQHDAGRLIGDCLTEGCSGELRTGSDGTATVIACGSLCGAVWYPPRWPELAERLGQRVAV